MLCSYAPLPFLQHDLGLFCPFAGGREACERLTCGSPICTGGLTRGKLHPAKLLEQVASDEPKAPVASNGNKVQDKVHGRGKREVRLLFDFHGVKHLSGGWLQQFQPKHQPDKAHHNGAHRR